MACSSEVNLGVPQGTVLGPLLFLVYIHDLSNELSSNPRLFADDMSLFSDTNLSANALNNDVLKINNWAYQWKISFNHDLSKQSEEYIFSRNIKKPSHPVLIFHNNQVIQTPYQKHLGLFLYGKFIFGEHLRYITNKLGIGLPRKLQKRLRSRLLVNIRKSFIRPYFDYEDVIFDQAYNK